MNHSFEGVDPNHGPHKGGLTRLPTSKFDPKRFFFQLWSFSPMKTKIASWNIPIFWIGNTWNIHIFFVNRKHIFIQGPFSSQI